MLFLWRQIFFIICALPADERQLLRVPPADERQLLCVSCSGNFQSEFSVPEREDSSFVTFGTRPLELMVNPKLASSPMCRFLQTPCSIAVGTKQALVSFDFFATKLYVWRSSGSKRALGEFSTSPNKERLFKRGSVHWRWNSEKHCFCGDFPTCHARGDSFNLAYLSVKPRCTIRM